eukprot:gene19691-23884_t
MSYGFEYGNSGFGGGFNPMEGYGAGGGDGAGYGGGGFGFGDMGGGFMGGAEEQKKLAGNASSINQNAAGWQGHEGIECTFMWPAAFGRVAQEYERRYGLDRRHLN